MLVKPFLVMVIFAVDNFAARAVYLANLLGRCGVKFE